MNDILLAPGLAMCCSNKMVRFLSRYMLAKMCEKLIISQSLQTCRIPDKFKYKKNKRHIIFGRPFVKRFAYSMLSDFCLFCPVLSVCLSVTFMYCGQTVRRIRMPLGTEVGLGPGYIVRWGPSSHRKKALS